MTWTLVTPGATTIPLGLPPRLLPIDLFAQVFVFQGSWVGSQGLAIHVGC